MLEKIGFNVLGLHSLDTVQNEITKNTILRLLIRCLHWWNDLATVLQEREHKTNFYEVVLLRKEGLEYSQQDRPYHIMMFLEVKRVKTKKAVSKIWIFMVLGGILSWKEYCFGDFHIQDPLPFIISKWNHALYHIFCWRLFCLISISNQLIYLGLSVVLF